MEHNTYHPQSRRDFLKNASAVLSTAFLGFCSNMKLSAAEKKKPRWELSCRDNLLAAFDAKTCWEAMDQLGITGVEASAPRRFISNSFFHNEIKYDLTSDSGLEELKRELKKQKKHISAFLMGNKLEGD